MTTTEEINHTKALIRRGIIDASDTFVSTAPTILAETCNGCGAAGAKFDFVPDTIWGLCICDVCFVHDWDYHEGTTQEHKDRADDRFLMNGINFIEAHSNWFTKIMRRRRMLKYYEAVSEFGDDAFWEGKTTANVP